MTDHDRGQFSKFTLFRLAKRNWRILTGSPPKPKQPPPQAHPTQLSDREWFAAHPDREFRLRALTAGEASNIAALTGITPGPGAEVVMRKISADLRDKRFSSTPFGVLPQNRDDERSLALLWLHLEATRGSRKPDDGPGAA